MPHAIPGNRKIKDGDLILIDMGCKYKGYCSDMTRMIFVNYIEDMNIKMLMIFVLKNNEMVEKELLKMEKYETIAQNSNNDLSKWLYSIATFSRTWCWFGHTRKTIFSITYDQQLKENMVVTVEPGVYKIRPIWNKNRRYLH